MKNDTVRSCCSASGSRNRAVKNKKSLVAGRLQNFTGAKQNFPQMSYTENNRHSKVTFDLTDTGRSQLRLCLNVTQIKTGSTGSSSSRGRSEVGGHLSLLTDLQVALQCSGRRPHSCWPPWAAQLVNLWPHPPSANKTLSTDCACVCISRSLLQIWFCSCVCVFYVCAWCVCRFKKKQKQMMECDVAYLLLF